MATCAGVCLWGGVAWAQTPECLDGLVAEAAHAGVRVELVVADAPAGDLVDAATTHWHTGRPDVLLWVDGSNAHLVSRWVPHRQARRLVQQARAADNWPCSLRDVVDGVVQARGRLRFQLASIAVLAALAAAALWWWTGTAKRASGSTPA